MSNHKDLICFVLGPFTLMKMEENILFDVWKIAHLTIASKFNEGFKLKDELIVKYLLMKVLQGGSDARLGECKDVESNVLASPLPLSAKCSTAFDYCS